MVDHATHAADLYRALRDRSPIEPLTSREPAITLDDAWAISTRFLALRLADGERVVGHKIGVTSKPVQDMLDVREPDYGWLTDRMRHDADIPIAGALIQPRAEAEIAFTLGNDLFGADLSEEEVTAAVASAHACFEIVDSRIRDWRIRIHDTVADNASSGMFALGPPVDPRGLDLAAEAVSVEHNGRVVSQGIGAAALGSPLRSLTWLVRTLSRLDTPLKAGAIVLSGSLVPLQPVQPGDTMTARFTHLGNLTVRFT